MDRYSRKHDRSGSTTVSSVNAKRLGPTGVASTGLGLDDETKEHLRLIVTSKLGRPGDLEPFIKQLDDAASIYRASKSVQDENLPKTVKQELKAALDASIRLNDRILRLGGKSRQFLYNYSDESIFDTFWISLNFIIEHLDNAHRRSLSDNKKGAPHAYAKLMLAALIAHAIRSHLGVKQATITRDGLYENVLQTILSAVQDREVHAVRDLMRQALKVNVIEQDNGLISIDPWVE